MKNINQFPEDFIFGVATSATQIEGAYLEDGKKLSIWDAFSHIPGNTVNGDTPAVACDSYHRYPEDIALMKELGVNSYRYSIAWTRVLPDGVGKVNQKGLDYYKRLTDSLLENGIMPNVTLYHWDFPYELERMGGWLNRDSIEWFSDYAKVIFDALGDRVPMFSTLNEPIATYVGYAQKGFAPGYGLEKYGKQALHHILTAHGKAVEVFRGCHLEKSKLGIVIDVWKNEPADMYNEADCDLATRLNENTHKFFFDALFKGRYSDYILQQMEKENSMPDIKAGDLGLINQPLDWFGLNCYNKIYISAEKGIQKEIKQTAGNYLDDGLRYYPESLYEAVKMMREEYGLKIPIYITENGTYAKSETEEQGVVEDVNRARYVKDFLKEVVRANQDGYDVKGYYLWSLMDNFEWSAGYSTKFGICSVDPQTLERKMKRSALEYKEIIKNRRV